MEVSGWGTGERKFHRSTRPRGGRCSSVERPAFVSPTQELVSTQKLQLLIQTSFSLGTQISLFSENVFWAWVYIYQFWNYIRCCRIFFNPEHCLYPSRSFEELQLGFSPACNKCSEILHQKCICLQISHLLPEGVDKEPTNEGEGETEEDLDD